MVTNALAGYESLQIVSADAAGLIVSPLVENDFSSLFASPGGSPDPVRWTFTVVATNPEAIDVVSVDAAPRAPLQASMAPSTACNRRP
jgi:hypothetical protein